MAPKINETTITLNNGKLMPLLGLGCWQSKGDDVEKAVEYALRVGYRHIDTAYNYLNEDSVGRGIRQWTKVHRGNRKEIFVVTKLPSIGMTPDGVEKFLKKSLAALKLSHVDLYLIHGPVGMKGKDDNDIFPFGEDGQIIRDDSTDLIAIWKAMEHMVDRGLTQSIGISNFSIPQMKKICANARIPPAVNQVELHAYFQRKELQEFCRESDIVITAYAPLGSPGRVSSGLGDSSTIPHLLEDPVVTLVAQNHKVTSAQVLIRFLIQSGMTTIPKSVTPLRIKSNADVFSFKLTDLEMEALKSLDKEEATFKFSIFPGLEDHPECP